MTAITVGQPPDEPAEDDRRDDREEVADVRDEGADEREESPDERAGHAEDDQGDPVDDALRDAEHGRDDHVPAHVVAVAHERDGDERPHRVQLPQHGRHESGVHGHEQQHGEEDDEERDPAREAADETAEEPDQLSRIESPGDVADLVGTDADRGEPRRDVLAERDDLVLELRQQLGELPERDEHEIAEPEEQQRHGGDHRAGGDAARHAALLEPHPQRVHADREHEGEEHRAEDAGDRGDAEGCEGGAPDAHEDERVAMLGGQFHGLGRGLGGRHLRRIGLRVGCLRRLRPLPGPPHEDSDPRTTQGPRSCPP